MNSDLQMLKEVLDKSDVSDESKRIALATIWTQDELPDVESDEQCDKYKHLRNELRAAGPPPHTMEWSMWTRTNEGILYLAYEVKIHEWDARGSDD